MTDLQFPYGIDLATGRMVTPDMVPRGAACGCVCTGCSGPLIAAQGDIVRPYFRHAVDGADGRCNYSPESDAHRWAKQIILDAGYITVPRLTANYRGNHRVVSEARRIVFTSAASEVRLDDARQPDILAQTEAGPLAIEIWVAHRVEPDKRLAFAMRGLAAIEIDLSGWRRGPPETVVLTSANRVWLFHPDKAAADASFIIEEQERERLIAEREAELQRLRVGWAAAKAAEREADREARAAKHEEDHRLWLERVAERQEEQRRLEAEAGVVREAQRREQAVKDAAYQRQRAELEIAAARSAVLVWEQCWQDIPDGQGTLARARANLAATEARHA